LSIRFVDSNVFIYVLMNDPSYATKSVHILTRFEEGVEIGWTSTLALAQVFAHLRKRKKYPEIDKFYDYLEGSPISVAETTRLDIEQARKLKHELKLPWSMWDDLVLASQMWRLRITEIYSNDGDFDKVKGLKRIF
jgi:predicted nucleic acid-binding protein